MPNIASAIDFFIFLCYYVMVICYYAKVTGRVTDLKDMNEKRSNDWLTPEGTRDMLFEECTAKREISECVTKLFENYGYSEVTTTGLEFFDVFNGIGRQFPQETMYKLVDGKNRLMVLRPDSTLPIARLAATRLRDEELPLKLFYNQNIFMVNPKDSGRDDEISQCGIEILGGKSEAADFEALVLAAKALEACDKDYRIEIGDSGIFNELLIKYHCGSELAANTQNWIESKNLPMLDNVYSSDKIAEEDRNFAEAFKALPRLFGGFEVFEKAREILKGEVLEQKLANLEKFCRDLSEVIPEEKIRVDLGLLSKKNYYTGIIFRGYVEGYGQPALSGGRYDRLLGTFGRYAGAVGFAVNVEAVTRVLLKKGKSQFERKPDVIVWSENPALALKHCNELISEGFTALNSVLECPKCTKKYAKEHNIKRVDIVDKDGKVTSEEV